MIIRSLTQVLSPAGDGGKLSILIFHRVHSHPDPLFPDEPDIRRFDAVIGWLSRWFNVLPLDVAVMHLRSATLPARAAAISFDDGYADNVDNALPVLLRHHVPATFFVATSFLDGGRMWNDSVIEALRYTEQRLFDGRAWGLGVLPLETLEHRRCAVQSLLACSKYLEPAQRQAMVDQVQDWAGVALPNDLMMRSEQLLDLRNAHMQIGAHTVSHPILERATDAQARWEILSSKDDLQARLDQPVTLFAYPNGKPDTDYSARHVAMVREAGFVAAVSTATGVSAIGSDPHQLPRFTPWDRGRARFGARLLINLRHTACDVTQR
ncbi:MAG: polysaccharide deacetylase family protein [Rhodoferax sp.]|nr:polysaccharide deacetylase family protein [Rhodoferax sp.]